MRSSTSRYGSAGSALPRLRRVVAVAGQGRVEVNDLSEWAEVTVPFESESWALTTLLGLGSDVEVLAPARLRDRMGTETRAAADRYAPETRPGHPGRPGRLRRPGWWQY